MATDETGGQRPELRVYLREWMEYLPVSDIRLAEDLGVRRETIWKWKAKGYLRTDRIAQIAFKWQKKPIELLSPPGRPSIDAKLANASDDLHRKVAEIVDTLLKTGS